jgi:bacterioferritin-associated ferredoxin
MIVCLCNRVSERQITQAVRSGIRCFELLQDETRVASSCGRCQDSAREVFASACADVHHDALPSPASAPAHAAA